MNSESYKIKTNIIVALLALILGNFLVGAESGHEPLADRDRQEIESLLAIAIRHGFPDTKNCQIVTGTVVVRKALAADQAGQNAPASFPISHGSISATRSGNNTVTHDGYTANEQSYTGVARHLQNDDWLMGESELITVDDKTHIDVRDAVRFVPRSHEPAFPSILPSEMAIAGQELLSVLAAADTMEKEIGAEKITITERFVTALDNQADIPLFTPISLLYRFQAGEQIPRLWWQIVDDSNRLKELSGFSDVPVRVFILDHIDELPQSAGGNLESENNSTFREENPQPIDRKKIWPTPSSPVEVARRLLIAWFARELRTGQTTNQRDTQLAMIALGEKPESILDGPQAPLTRPKVTAQQASSARVLVRLQMKKPEIMHKRVPRKLVTVDDLEPPVIQISVPNEIVQQTKPTIDSEAKAKESFTAWDHTTFSVAEIPEVIGYLLDERLTCWTDQYGGSRPVGDAALRAVAEFLQFDPRHLFGISVRSAWDENARRETARKIADWWLATHHLPIAEAIAFCAHSLTSSQAVQLLLSTPANHREPLIRTLVADWAHDPSKRFDFSQLSRPRAAQVVAALCDSPTGQAALTQLDLAKQSVFFRALVAERQGDRAVFDHLLADTFLVQTQAPANEPLLVRQLLVATNANLNLQRAALVLRALRRPLSQPITQALLMQGIFPSSWVDDQDALLANTTRDEDGLLFHHYGEPSYLNWLIWSLAIDNQQKLPAELAASCTVDAGGDVSIHHPGAQATYALISQTHPRAPDSSPKLPVQFAELRVCDFVAWALLAQYEHLFTTLDANNQSQCPQFDLTDDQQHRDLGIAALRKMIRAQARRLTPPPLTMPWLDNFSPK